MYLSIACFVSIIIVVVIIIIIIIIVVVVVIIIIGSSSSSSDFILSYLLILQIKDETREMCGFGKKNFPDITDCRVKKID